MSEENNVVYDAEEERIEAEAAQKEKEEKQEVIYDAKDPEVLRKEAEEKKKEEEVAKGPDPTVFTDGLSANFVMNHKCPLCGNTHKKAVQLEAKAGLFKKRVVGYMSICANCGNVNFYANNHDDLLAYLRGKPLKGKKLEKSRKGLK